MQDRRTACHKYTSRICLVAVAKIHTKYGAPLSRAYRSVEFDDVVFVFGRSAETCEGKSWFPTHTLEGHSVLIFSQDCDGTRNSKWLSIDTVANNNDATSTVFDFRRRKHGRGVNRVLWC